MAFSVCGFFFFRSWRKGKMPPFQQAYDDAMVRNTFFWPPRTHAYHIWGGDTIGKLGKSGEKTHFFWGGGGKKLLARLLKFLTTLFWHLYKKTSIFWGGNLNIHVLQDKLFRKLAARPWQNIFILIYPSCTYVGKACMWERGEGGSKKGDSFSGLIRLQGTAGPFPPRLGGKGPNLLRVGEWGGGEAIGIGVEMREMILLRNNHKTVHAKSLYVLIKYCTFRYSLDWQYL